MNFSDALTAIRHGDRMQRAGWNGKGMYIVYVRATVLDPEDIAYFAGRTNIENGRLQPYIAMMTVDGTFVPWLCSQTDMLADDWEIVR